MLESDAAVVTVSGDCWRVRESVEGGWTWSLQSEGGGVDGWW